MLGKFIKHQHQYQDKYQLDVIIHRALINLPSSTRTSLSLSLSSTSPSSTSLSPSSSPSKSSPLPPPPSSSSSSSSSYFVHYKRGEHKGSSLLHCSTSSHSHTIVSINFDYSFSVPITLFYTDQARKNYDDKVIVFSIHENAPSEKKGYKTIAKARVNITPHVIQANTKGITVFPITQPLPEKAVRIDAYKLQLTLTIKRDLSNLDDTSSLAISPPKAPPPPARTSLLLKSQEVLSALTQAISEEQNKSPVTLGSSPPPPPPPGPPAAIPSPPPMMPEALSVNIRNAALRRELSEGALRLSRSPDRVEMSRPKLATRERSFQLDNRRSKRDSVEFTREDSMGLMGGKLEVVLKQQDDERFLVDEFIKSKKPVYSNGVAVSAYVLFRALLQWRSFRSGNSRLLERLTDALEKLIYNNTPTSSDEAPTDETSNDAESSENGASINENGATNTEKPQPPKLEFEQVLYFLSTTVTLLHLLRRELQVISTNSLDGVVKPFDTKLFHFASSFYEIFCSMINEQLNPLVTEVIQTIASQGSETGSVNPEKLISVLSSQYTLIQNNIPFEELREQLIKHQIHYISIRILNPLFTEDSGICRCGSGLSLKMVVLEVEDWAEKKGSRVESVVKESLAVLRQVTDVLSVNKMSLLQESVRVDVCPALSYTQLIRLLEVYSPDEFDSEPVHPGVISIIKSKDTQHQDSPLEVDPDYISPLIAHFTKAAFDTRTLVVPPHILSRACFTFLRQESTTDSSPW